MVYIQDVSRSTTPTPGGPLAADTTGLPQRPVGCHTPARCPLAPTGHEQGPKTRQSHHATEAVLLADYFRQGREPGGHAKDSSSKDAQDLSRSKWTCESQYRFSFLVLYFYCRTIIAIRSCNNFMKTILFVTTMTKQNSKLLELAVSHRSSHRWQVNSPHRSI